ncbi:50S ribosomal protein L9 [Elusimicrobiota bacterium]
MKVILKADFEKLGKLGDNIEVSAGYARNYLLPKGLVWPYEEKYIKQIDGLRRKKELQLTKIRTTAEAKAKEIENLSVTIAVEVGEDDRLFGSVTNLDVAYKLEEAGIIIEKKSVLIDEPIKKLGVYKVEVKLHPEVSASCKVWVVNKQ